MLNKNFILIRIYILFAGLNGKLYTYFSNSNIPSFIEFNFHSFHEFDYGERMLKFLFKFLINKFSFQLKSFYNNA